MMSTYKARREPRVNVALDVFLQTLHGEESFVTRNASYAGVFIVCPDPFPLRKLIRFKTRLPNAEEDVQMMGLVAHTINAADAAELGRPPGMGIQIFSLGDETRQKWRDYIGEEYDKSPEAREAIELSEIPRVRVRIPNHGMLEKFYARDLPSGGIFLRTAELHPEGTHVECDIVHPDDGRIFVIEAVVSEVIPAPVRERGIRLAMEPLQDMSTLRRFIDGEDEA
ncbi:MAG: PilZ domain-containing protein [Bradymonadaceae bacterium]